ncbi:hypothetical protein HPB49_005656 [Dermacentor silvarum]|uniref:Uncharacterized protein n=1 Tax=Dermacentor silvarum TaxID=543639 RepID=A0ACB8CPT4_DERSI|nr:hypothetical protein HPB49_005656 [Dermacentor silvarum]
MVSARRLKDDRVFGVDSRWSWITAFFCAWVLFLAMATPRMAGIFFYGIVETFGATREEASWPVSLPGTFTVLGGTASSGLYVASNVLLAQHFEKRRATASSLVFTVFGFDSVFITPLIEFFRTTNERALEVVVARQYRKSECRQARLPETHLFTLPALSLLVIRRKALLEKECQGPRAARTLQTLKQVILRRRQRPPLPLPYCLVATTDGAPDFSKGSLDSALF